MHELRIVPTCTERFRIAEIRLFGPGEPPPEVQRWEILDKCDLMLLTAHPDDEILWFAGLMPTYGGDRGYRIQVTVVVPTGAQRKLELLGAVWHCGVRYYPEMLGFIDKNGQNPERQYSIWHGKGRPRRTRRRAVLKQTGEQRNIPIPRRNTEPGKSKSCTCMNMRKIRLPATGTSRWQHSEERPDMKWRRRLSVFMPARFSGDWAFEVHGKHDNASFGLYYTSVGKDSGIGDLMEHIKEE